MGMNPRLLRPRASGYTATDADARAYISAVQTADGSRLEDGVARAINTFVAGCKSDGIWSAIKASCILMGARTLSGALTPLVGTAPTNNNFVSGDYNRKTGLIGNRSTKYINTNRAANADPQNSVHASVYVSQTEPQIGVLVWLASNSAATKNIGVFWYQNAYYFNARRQVAGNTTASDTTLSTGFVGVARSSSSAVTGRAENATQSFTETSTTPSSDPYYVFGGNDQGTAGNLSASRIAFYSVGENLTLSLLDSRVTTLYNAIGSAIL